MFLVFCICEVVNSFAKQRFWLNSFDIKFWQKGLTQFFDRNFDNKCLDNYGKIHVMNVFPNTYGHTTEYVHRQPKCKRMTMVLLRPAKTTTRTILTTIFYDHGKVDLLNVFPNTGNNLVVYPICIKFWKSGFFSITGICDYIPHMSFDIYFAKIADIN